MVKKCNNSSRWIGFDCPTRNDAPLPPGLMRRHDVTVLDRLLLLVKSLEAEAVLLLMFLLVVSSLLTAFSPCSSLATVAFPFDWRCCCCCCFQTTNELDVPTVTSWTDDVGVTKLADSLLANIWQFPARISSKHDGTWNNTKLGRC